MASQRVGSRENRGREVRCELHERVAEANYLPQNRSKAFRHLPRRLVGWWAQSFLRGAPREPTYSKGTRGCDGVTPRAARAAATMPRGRRKSPGPGPEPPALNPPLSAPRPRPPALSFPSISCPRSSALDPTPSVPRPPPLALGRNLSAPHSRTPALHLLPSDHTRSFPTISSPRSPALPRPPASHP
jgi:hypothetical protein